ncbi:MAG TPA: endonuclease/exonuclease/phosphatase family protein [Actinomycetota bacterium]|nr:endonuclease/exonuclease/phosphatase family protein [Actinomycetota bacterium]
MCGSACNKGSTGRVVTALRDSILDFAPDITLLNEACLAQVDAVWDQLDEEGFTTSACFGATAGRSLCPGPEGERWYGNAVLSRGVGIGQPEAVKLPNRPRLAEQRAIISMAADLKGVPAMVSSAHLAPREKDEVFNRRQITELARIHNDRAAAGNVVIFGGDFNATPGQVKEITGPGGRFRDVDHADLSPTFSRRKIDYVLLDSAHFFGLTASVTRSPVSDHRLLKGRARLSAVATG